MSRSNLIVGSGVTLWVNGARFANVIEFNWALATPRNKLRGVDATEPFELALTSTEINGSLSVYRMRQDGGAEGAGFTTTMPDLSRESYFSLLLIEEASNTILFEARRCSLESQAWAVPNRQYVLGHLSWSAIDYSNEIRPL